MKLLTIILLFTCIPVFSQKETTISINIDSTEQRRVLFDSLLKTYSKCEIFVIIKVTENKVYIKRLCDKKGKPDFIRKEPDEVFKEGYFFTVLNEFNY